MATPGHPSASTTSSLIKATSFCIILALAAHLHAQTTVPPTANQPAITDAAALPDAPTPTNTVLAANEAPPTFSTSADLDLSQQATTPPLNTRQQAPTTATPSLDDLGLTPAQTKPDPDLQARLDRRTHMLKVHQALGLWTVIPIAAACISGAGATPSRNNYTSTASRDAHVGISALGIGMYALTASYAIRAPRVPEGPVRGGIKIHKYLIWIHAPGMILTPILGTMAFNDIANGHKPGGIEQYHSAVALTTAIAYGASIIAVSWPIHLHL